LFTDNRINFENVDATKRCMAAQAAIIVYVSIIASFLIPLYQQLRVRTGLPVKNQMGTLRSQQRKNSALVSRCEAYA
jgi:hypothetical protein